MTRSLGIRLAVLVSVVLTILGVVAGTYVTNERSTKLRAEHRARAAAMLSALAVPCASVMASGERRRVDSFIAETIRRSETFSLLGIALLDHEAAPLVVHTKEMSPAEVLSDGAFVARAASSSDVIWQRYEEGEVERLAVSMPVVSGLRFGTLIAQLDSSEVKQAVAEVQTVVASVTVAAIVLTVGALWFALLLTVLRPVQRLMKAAEAVSNGALETRLGSHRADEVGRLSHAFDQMAGQLQSYTQGLERRVAEESAEVARQSEQLQEVNSRLKVAVAKLEKLAVTDELTGLSNRRHFNHMLRNELARTERSQTPLSLLIVDVDHFKSYNDTYGHPAGDVALKLIAETLRDTLRRTDCIARWGGEEFAVLLFRTGIDHAAYVAGKVQEALKQKQAATALLSGGTTLTVSIGIACATEHSTDPEELLSLADTALYRAKRTGRNKVVLTDGSLTLDEIDAPDDA